MEARPMTKYYTHYWSRDNCDFWRDVRKQEGEPMLHTAGELFERRGVCEDDVVYIVTIGEGILFLLAKMTVLKIVLRDEAVRLMGTTDLWEGT
jgi:hypothetical protein